MRGFQNLALAVNSSLNMWIYLNMVREDIHKKDISDGTTQVWVTPPPRPRGSKHIFENGFQG